MNFKRKIGKLAEGGGGASQPPPQKTKTKKVTYLYL